MTHEDGMGLLYDERIACILWTLQIICHKKTPTHTDVPATALLYDIVNAVYTKMYFLWKLCMCTVEQVVYVRQQTVQHTPVKLKTLVFNSKSPCDCICGDWDGGHEGETDVLWLESCSWSWMATDAPSLGQESFFLTQHYTP